jgi:CHAT domain-containing protein/Tfp pilus assembly protein PilF
MILLHGKEKRKIYLRCFRILATIFLFCSCATPSILVTKEQNLGDSFFNKQDYREAARHYNLMLDASSKLGIYRNPAMESAVHRKIANCFEMTGDYDKALEHVHMALRIDSAENNLQGKIEDYRHEGKIYIYMGSFQKGIVSVERSLELSSGMDQSLKNENRLSIADNYLVLAQLYSVMGRLGKSLEFTNKALSTFRQAGDKRGEMEAYLTLGNNYSDLGDIITSQAFAEQSISLAEELSAGTGRQYQLLSSLSSSLGKYEEALGYQEKALADAEKYRIIGQIIWSNIGMGDIYREIGDIKNAERYYNIAGHIKDTASLKTGSLQASLDLRSGDISRANEYYLLEGSRTGSALSCLKLSEIFIRDGKPDSALLLLDQAGSMFRTSGNLQGLSDVQLLKGSLMVDRQNYQQALRLLDSVKLAADFPESVWQAWFHLGRLYEKTGQDDKAIEAYRNSISVIEKIRGNLTIDEFRSIYLDNKRQVYDRLVNILLKNKMPVEAFQVSEQARARAFYDILAGRKINFGGISSGDLISQEQEKRIEIQKLYKLLQKKTSGYEGSPGKEPADFVQVRDALAEVRKEYDDIIRKIRINNPSYAEIVTAEPVKLKEIQSRIDTGTVVLEYWVSTDGLTIWMITHSEIISRTIDIKDTDLNLMIENTRRDIRNNSAAGTSKGLKELYNVLIEPVESDISSFSNLIIIPNQSLHFLPYQALKNSRSEYLIQRFNLSYAPSASVFMICNDRIVRSGSKFMGMALSDISVGNSPGLPGTTDELNKILPLFPDHISAFGQESTEGFAKKNSAECSFLHFATHGSYNYRQPLYSFLLFPPGDGEDGRLNVYEVFEMKLNARLVTLSACETGLGNISQGDELTGLSRAFLFAGSSTVIVSLWSVADEPTAMLMKNFYSYMRGHPVQEALAMAQRDVIKLYPQPAYWAPFILIGNGTIISQ